MYTNGYVPPRPDDDRRRRTQHAAAGQPESAAADSMRGARQPGVDTSSQKGWNQPGWGGSAAAGYQQARQGVVPPRQGVPASGAAPYVPKQGYPQQAYPPQQAYRGQGWADPRQGARPAVPGYQPQQAQRDYQPQGNGYVPPKPEGWRPGGNQPPRKPRNNLLVALIALVLLAGLGVGGYYILQDRQVQQYVTSYDNVFCQGVYVDGIHLGGMTADEGVAAVTAQAQRRNDSWSVNLTYQGQVVTTLNASQLGMTVDVADVLHGAWEQGHTGDAYQRKAAMEQLLQTPYQAYTAVPGGDTSVVDGVLEQIRQLVYRAPSDARLLSFNPENSYPFTFQEELEGRVLDTAPLKERLYQMVSTMESGDVEIVPDIIAPTVTVEQLKTKLTMRASVYTPISKNSTENRTNNIRRCFQSISGYILEPGSKFSFNSVVGKRTTANGFFEAIEYAYGNEVMGVGGGSCQASTTLYQAAVVAGLEIISREPHSDAVSYAAYGEDATVYWEGNRKIDLVFRNNTGSPLYFVAAVQSDPSNRKRFVARITIYGESLGDNVRYELTSQTVEVLKPPEEPEYVKDTKQQYVTYVDEEYVARKSKEGYVVESYRLKYVNDQLVEQTLLATDTYKAKSMRIYVGTKKRE